MSHLKTSLQALLQKTWPETQQRIAVLPCFTTLYDDIANIHSQTTDYLALWQAMHCEALQLHVQAHGQMHPIEQFPFFAIKQPDPLSIHEFDILIDQMAGHFELEAVLIICAEQAEQSFTISYDHELGLQTQQQSSQAIHAFFQLLLHPLAERAFMSLAEDSICLSAPQTNMGGMAKLLYGKSILNDLKTND